MDEPYTRAGPSSKSPAGRYATIGFWVLVVIAIILVGWALRAIGSIAVPIVFAFFLSLLVAPIDLQVRTRMSARLRWVGHVAAMATIFFGLAIFVGCLWLAAQQVVSRFAEEPSGLVSMIPELTSIEGTAGQGQDAATGAGNAADLSDASPQDAFLGALREAAGSFAINLQSWASDIAGTIVTMAGSFVSSLVLIFFLTLLMLVEAPRWRGKLVTLSSRSTRDDAINAIEVIAARLRRFLLVRLVLGLITAALYAGWIWIFGLDLILVWALLAVLMNFVPTIGSLIAGILPVLYAFLTKDFGTAVLVGIGILVIEQVMGNYVDPRVQGKTISISPLVILIALLFWGWVWGIAGALLAVPITITFLVMGTHISALKPFALLISDETDMEGLEHTAGH